MSETGLTVRNEQALEQRPAFSDEQVQLLKDTVCKGATNVELALFLEVCKSKRLDPFSRQIHAVKRPVKDGDQWKEVMAFQTGIDGFRLIAERSKEYAGQSAPLWCGEDGVWKDVWLSSKPPSAAKVSVHRHGFVEPMTRIAKYSEFVQKKSGGDPVKMWATMPTNQLAKCAEAASLRAAFPEELSGLYVHEEMDQAENDTAPAPKTRAEKVSDAQAVAAAKLTEMKQLGVSQDDAKVIHDAVIVDEDPGPTPPTWIKDMMPAFAEMKEKLSEPVYRGIMTAAGYANKNLLMKQGRPEASRVYKLMVVELKRMKLRAGDLEELAEMREKDPMFEAWIAANCSITWADLEQASAEEISKVLAAARER